jgi:hypothetical protein
MNETILDQMEKAMRRQVPYEGLLNRQLSPYGKRSTEASEPRISQTVSPYRASTPERANHSNKDVDRS